MNQNSYLTLDSEICENHIGKELGYDPYKRECAAGIQYLFEKAGKPIGLTSTWKKGDLVKGNKNITIGTAIASFDGNGKYWKHAAIYEGQNEKGIQVWDQWKTKPWGKRTLSFKDGDNADGSNNGNLFYTVKK